ncbi:MAG: acyl-[acyl-carrier-protein] thioesterase, partial [Lachnospiraceae bacterium]|nr:acyl-[acyl-carrier-protein] thioesterase [Lachnospiraceae bacterium]
MKTVGNGYAYEYSTRIGFSACDVNNELSLTALIDLFQDASIFQSEDAGVGFDVLREHDLLWVLNYWEIEIDRFPKLCENVTVGTYPFDFKSFMGYRNFYLKDEAGNMPVRANTTWTMVDIKKMTPVKAPDFIVNAYTLGPKLDMTYSPRKILLPDEDSCEKREAETRTVELHHLDGNMHVNNCQYINFGLTAIGEELKIKSLRADYRLQAHHKDKIYPVVYKTDDGYTAAL